MQFFSKSEMVKSWSVQVWSLVPILATIDFSTTWLDMIVPVDYKPGSLREPCVAWDNRQNHQTTQNFWFLNFTVCKTFTVRKILKYGPRFRVL